MFKHVPTSLREAVCSTFEELGFVFPDEELLEHQEQADLAYSVSVCFAGPLQGSLGLSLSRAVAREVAANMLGAVDIDDEKIVSDAVGEIANVICGNAVQALATPEAEFLLGVPVARGPESVERGDGRRVAEVEFGVGDGRARAWIEIVEECRAETVP
ncbi:MAG: chemotaxis protein CheX [Gemmatimonadota bacterium]